MEWEALLLQLGTTLITSGVLVGTIVWLGKSYFEKWFEIEKNKTINEHQIIFAKLQERRFEKIDELYGKILDAETSSKAYLNPMKWGKAAKDEDQKMKALVSLGKLRQCKERNEIYFNQTFNDKLEKLWGNFFEHLTDFVQEYEQSEKKEVKTWDKIWNQFLKKTPQVKEEIKKELREIMGVKA
jgi:hypothetical protein